MAGTVYRESLAKMERWSGKIALVTGASAGIGAKISEELARHGLKVVAVARRPDKLEALKTKVQKHGFPGKIYPLQCDVSKEEDILKVFKWIEKEFGRLDVLVNNAAVLFPERITEGSTENFRKTMNINVIAVAICAREAVKLMAKDKSQGHIINISSIAGHNAELIRNPVSLYACSKYAVRAMCESLRHEILAMQRDIKITSISPGVVKTDMVMSLSEAGQTLDKIPMLSEKDIADGVVYALSTPPTTEVRQVTITPLHQMLL